MSVESLYKSPFGRSIVVLMQKSGAFHLAGWFLRTKLSRKMIPGYIEKNQIDMEEFAGQEYTSFADFFSRKKEAVSYSTNPESLMSPCDGLLSAFRISEDMVIAMKNSHYRLSDILPEPAVADSLKDGICLIFRLQASDYHHFCAFDDAELLETHFLPGRLHSVQPIACDQVPVYRLNRRWWSVLETVHFGRAVQVEIGAMLVGGVRFEKEAGSFSRGDEMGNFELSGSTIILLLSSDIRKRLEFVTKFQEALDGEKEIPVRMGETVGFRKESQSSVK